MTGKLTIYYLFACSYIVYVCCSVSEARAAKQFISEEKMANYLQGLHIANETHYPSGMLMMLYYKEKLFHTHV